MRFLFNIWYFDIKSVTVRYSKTVSNLVQPEKQSKIIIQEQEAVEKLKFLTYIEYAKTTTKLLKPIKLLKLLLNIQTKQKFIQSQKQLIVGYN